MRTVPEEMAARIESGAATICTAWVLRPIADEPLGFTDHDRDLDLGGVVCRAEGGWTQGAAEAASGLAPGTATVGGATDDLLSEADILAGRFDGAKVETWRVDWERPDLSVLMRTGRIARLKREGTSFVAELEGPATALDVVVGRTYGRMCDARLGDAPCGVDVSDFPGLSCDRTLTTCRERFGNIANFQGFPDIPGEDFLTVYPVEGGRNDGGSRR